MPSNGPEESTMATMTLLGLGVLLAAIGTGLLAVTAPRTERPL